MEPTCRFYIEHLFYDGDTYTKGAMTDTFEKWGIVCKEFPFKVMPEAKDFATRDWVDEDGTDVYVPASVKMKAYEAEAEFICTGADTDLQTNVRSFINYLYGKEGATQLATPSARLAIYDEYTKTGRKDVVVQKVSPDAYYTQHTDTEAVIVFKVSFMVYDPVTDVEPHTISSTTSLNWKKPNGAWYFNT